MTSDSPVVSRHAEVRAVLSDPLFTVDPVPHPPFALTVAWLRGAVGRFAEGAVHDKRRAAGVAVLARLDPDALRAEAFRLASEDPESAELVPVRVLAVALGVRAEDGARAVEAVAMIALAYLPGPGEVDAEAADEGLVRLSHLLGDPDPERLAVLAGLLAQAYGATAGLVRGALAAEPVPCTVEELLVETLRFDPPVRVLRRTAAGEGKAVVLDVAAANRDPEVFADPDRFRPGREPQHLTFGAGSRSCPAQRIALALAAGAVEAAR
ncbi:Cytochrome P450 [Streptosporangium subroseum]|uniref:Cytochrome P450 n=1 Tax=Streptosporangium subroseum TaxID=106412 RepID=A0A239EF94_9ACTN|nr:cytochrome P450 [Streptosporangium subroseum]SNS43316.1 Cytochrome P450 [Streptosporangium subroseum]